MNQFVFIALTGDVAGLINAINTANPTSCQ